MEIISTTDYSKFQFLSDNRKVNKAYLKRLTASIQQLNLLYMNPIVIDKNWHVIDGQHRLLAAKALGVEIYYFMVNKVDYAAVQILNSIKLSWTWTNYIESFAEAGLQEYKWLLRTSKNADIALNVMLRLGLGNQKGLVMLMKTGELEIIDKEKYLNQIRMLKEVGLYYKGFTRSEFVKAFRFMINKPEFEWEHFIGIVKQYPSILFDCVAYSEHLRQLEQIYNRDLRGANKIRLV